jgi:hypothetical protein
MVYHRAQRSGGDDGWVRHAQVRRVLRGCDAYAQGFLEVCRHDLSAAARKHTAVRGMRRNLAHTAS